MKLMQRRTIDTRTAHAQPAAVLVSDAWKTYPGSDHAAVEAFGLEVRPREVVALLGPSGCGKTTALRMLAGLERPDQGIIDIAGRRAFGAGTWVPPEKRSVGMVFQDYALFPHLNVRGNVAYGLNRLPRDQRRERIEQVLALTGLAVYARRYPHELSGGQQQRVAIARAIAPRPAVMLLDEPFSNLDVGMRERVRSEVLGILRAAGASVVLVTHDQDEAFVAADRIAVMSAGRVHQVGSAEDLYYRPATRFVAEFVGIANFLISESTGAGLQSEIGVFGPAADGGEPRDILLRPEQIELAEVGAPATVVRREFHGHDWLYVLRLESGTELRTIGPSMTPTADRRVSASATAGRRRHFVPAGLAEEHRFGSFVVQVDASPSWHWHRSPEPKRFVGPAGVCEPCRENAAVRDDRCRELRLFDDRYPACKALRCEVGAFRSSEAELRFLKYLLDGLAELVRVANPLFDPEFFEPFNDMHRHVE